MEDPRGSKIIKKKSVHDTKAGKFQIIYIKKGGLDPKRRWVHQSEAMLMVGT